MRGVWRGPWPQPTRSRAWHVVVAVTAIVTVTAIIATSVIIVHV